MSEWTADHDERLVDDMTDEALQQTAEGLLLTAEGFIGGLEYQEVKREGELGHLIPLAVDSLIRRLRDILREGPESKLTRALAEAAEKREIEVSVMERFQEYADSLTVVEMPR